MTSIPRVIAPRASSYMMGIISTFDTVVSGIDPPVLSGLIQSLAIVVDNQTILYMGYSETSNYYLTKVDFFLHAVDKHLCLHFVQPFFFDSII